jgi:hypothetical protein
MPDAVTNPQTGEAVNLRECPHQQQVRFGAVPDFRQQIERFVQELDVGFVQGQQDVGRHGVDEARQFLAAGGGAGGIVRIGDEDDARVGRDGGQHRVEVVGMIFRRHDDEFRAEQGGHDGINRKAVLRRRRALPRRRACTTEQRVPDHFDDFIGAVAEDEVGRRHAEFGGQLLFQVKRVAVGVKVHLLERLAHGGQTQARRAERVFVRRELDDAGGVQAEFAGDFLDGPARLIHRQMDVLKRNFEFLLRIDLGSSQLTEKPKRLCRCHALQIKSKSPGEFSPGFY